MNKLLNNTGSERKTRKFGLIHMNERAKDFCRTFEICICCMKKTAQPIVDGYCFCFACCCRWIRVTYSEYEYDHNQEKWKSLWELGRVVLESIILNIERTCSYFKWRQKKTPIVQRRSGKKLQRKLQKSVAERERMWKISWLSRKKKINNTIALIHQRMLALIDSRLSSKAKRIINYKWRNAMMDWRTSIISEIFRKID